MSNLKQCGLAWLTYNADFSGRFAYNEEGDIADPNAGNYAPQGWVYGWEGFTGSSAPPDPVDANTNTDYCLNANYAQLGPYLKSIGVLRCPADMSGDSPGGAGTPRQRSYSMSQSIGANHNGTLGTGTPNDPYQGMWLTYKNYLVYLKESDLSHPSPSKLWVLTDENADSIEDAAFAFAMPIKGQSTKWIDVPSKRHNNACGFNFADGHAEIHKWLMPQNIPGELNGPSANNPQWPTLDNQNLDNGQDPDMFWMGWRTSYPIIAGNASVLMGYPDPAP